MNELSPSNSLLSAVLGIKCEHNDYVISSADCMFTNYKAMNKTLRFKVTENLHIFEKYPEKRLKEINLSVFMEMCKEWAFENNFVLSSQLTNYFDATNDTVRSLGYCYIENINTSPNFYSHSEQQAVFDCCQWILGNKDKQ